MGNGLQLEPPRSYRGTPFNTGDGLQMEPPGSSEYRKIAIHPNNFIPKWEDEDGNLVPAPVPFFSCSKKKSKKQKNVKMYKLSYF